MTHAQIKVDGIYHYKQVQKYGTIEAIAQILQTSHFEDGEINADFIKIIKNDLGWRKNDIAIRCIHIISEITKENHPEYFL